MFDGGTLAEVEGTLRVLFPSRRASVMRPACVKGPFTHAPGTEFYEVMLGAGVGIAGRAITALRP
jgi:hypothetical protein